jgi:hypothetical protein
MTRHDSEDELGAAIAEDHSRTRKRPMSTPLRFHELAIGDHFISFPQDGDDSGHGGYRRGSYVFRKTRECPPGEPWRDEPNDVRLIDGVATRCTPDMLVYKVLL